MAITQQTTRAEDHNPSAQIAAHQTQYHQTHGTHGQASRLQKSGRASGSSPTVVQHTRNVFRASPGSAAGTPLHGGKYHPCLPSRRSPVDKPHALPPTYQKATGHGSHYRTDMSPPNVPNRQMVPPRGTTGNVDCSAPAALAPGHQGGHSDFFWMLGSHTQPRRKSAISTYYDLVRGATTDPTRKADVPHQSTSWSAHPFAQNATIKQPVHRSVRKQAPESPAVYSKYEVKDEEAMSTSLPKFMKKYAPPFDRDANNALVLLVDELYFQDKFQYPGKDVDGRTRHACSIGYPIRQTSRSVGHQLTPRPEWNEPMFGSFIPVCISTPTLP